MFLYLLHIQAPQFTSCTANIIMYNITVMDQYSPAIITVPAASMLSVEISQFPDNGTSIVANREYTITLSAISDQGTSYPGDPVTISKFSYMYKCKKYILLHICVQNKLIFYHLKAMCYIC